LFKDMVVSNVDQRSSRPVDVECREGILGVMVCLVLIPCFIGNLVNEFLHPLFVAIIRREMMSLRLRARVHV
ncbi:MAG: hypothetical protein IKY07_04555, partial [Clostridia bacterium]|nr:hypothetical protein [Clostridia bacterium]